MKKNTDLELINNLINLKENAKLDRSIEDDVDTVNEIDISNESGIPEDIDKLFVVYALVKLGLSFRRIGKAINHHHTTVKSLYLKALQENDKLNLSISAIDGKTKKPRFVSVGGTRELENIENAIIERQSGRRAIGHKAEY